MYQSQRIPKRWNGFLTDVKIEGTMYTDVLSKASIEKEETNLQYKTISQRSFNAIHNVKRRPPPSDTGVPHVKKIIRRKTFEEEPKIVDEIQYIEGMLR